VVALEADDTVRYRIEHGVKDLPEILIWDHIVLEL
jgi:hypothetical protein